MQIDFSNAFNCLDRSHLFREVREHAPGLSAFVEWSHGSHSWLFFGAHTLMSQTGLLQRDPLARLLFALGLQPVVLHLVEKVPGLILIAWYLDDGVLVGGPQHLLQALNILQNACPNIGLSLSLTKTTFWRHPSYRDTPPEVNIQNFNVPELLDGGVILLGAPVGTSAFCLEAAHQYVSKIAAIMDKLRDLGDSQVQFTLLRSCFGFPKITYCRRTSDPSIARDAFKSFNESQCRAVADCVGAQFSTNDRSWLHASIPVSLRGLGIRSAYVRCLAAFDAEDA